MIDPPVVNTGGTVAFLGTGCENESTVTFVVEPLDLELGETSPVDGGDFYLADVVITLEPGVYPVTAVKGDCTGDGLVDIADLFALMSWFVTGIILEPLDAVELDGEQGITLGDAEVLRAYLFP